MATGSGAAQEGSRRHMKRNCFTVREGRIGHLSLRFHLCADLDSSCQSRLALLSMIENCEITCAGTGALRTCKRVVTFSTGVSSVRTCQRVEAGRSLETEPPPVWARRRSSNRFGTPQCWSEARWSGEVGRRGGAVRRKQRGGSEAAGRKLREMVAKSLQAKVP